MPLSPSYRADAVRVLDKRLWDSEDTSDLLDDYSTIETTFHIVIYLK